MGAEFAYQSVMTSIIRLHPYLLEDSGVHHQLLGYARTSLSSLQEMLTHAKTLTDAHTFKVSVSWSVARLTLIVLWYFSSDFITRRLILFYPLYPFFVLFTHTVNTSSVQDFQLLSNVTTGLRDFAAHNSALMGVQRLFEGFTDLCRPIFQGSALNASNPQVSSRPTNDARSPQQSSGHDLPEAELPSSIGPVWNNPFTLNNNGGSGTNWAAPQASGPAPLAHLSTLEEHDLLAELYSTQPSIGWIDGIWPT